LLKECANVDKLARCDLVYAEVQLKKIGSTVEEEKF
jgi:hypothetical protein